MSQTSPPPTIRLRDLIAPLSVEEFVDEHWLVGKPHLGQVAPGLVDSLLGIDGLGSPQEVIARHSRNVRTFGPDGERTLVPPDEGMMLYERGHTLYIDYLHRTIPEAHRLLSGVAADMGMEPWQITLEAFAGRAGAVSTRHFDHDVTIQVLLSGEKDWTFEANELVNPLHPYHPPKSVEDKLAAFSEEVYRSAANGDCAQPIALRAKPGSAVFLARGWWHSTRSETDTWSFNLVFHSVSWARAFSRALEIRLHANPNLRAYCGGFAPWTRPPTDRERQHRAATMSLLRVAAVQAAEEVSTDEVPLALLGFLGRMFRWSPNVSERRLQETPDGWHLVVGEDAAFLLTVPGHLVPVVEVLCTLRSNIRWDAIPPLVHDCRVGEVYKLLTQLIKLDAIEVVHPGVGA